MPMLLLAHINLTLPLEDPILKFMLILVIIVSISSLRKCFELSKTVPASYTTTKSVEEEGLKKLQELVATDPKAKRFAELTCPKDFKQA